MATGLESGKTDVGTYATQVPISSLTNPHKYTGKRKIIQTRSSWELGFLKYLDTNSAILEWSSEEVVIDYFHPIHKREARYWVDFWCKFQTPKDGIKEALIEIKPFKDTQKPIVKESYKASTNVYAVANYAINQAKWFAAKQFCKSKGLKFFILTEHDIVFNPKKVLTSVSSS